MAAKTRAIFLRVVADIARLGHHLGHHDDVARLVGGAQGGDRGGQLVAQRQDEAGYHGTGVPCQSKKPPVSAGVEPVEHGQQVGGSGLGRDGGVACRRSFAVKRVATVPGWRQTTMASGGCARSRWRRCGRSGSARPWRRGRRYQPPRRLSPMEPTRAESAAKRAGRSRGHQPERVLEHQRGADGVERELRGKRLRDRAHAGFSRARARRSPARRWRRGSCRRAPSSVPISVGDARLVGQIETIGARDRPVTPAPATRERSDKCRADAARRADHQCPFHALPPALSSARPRAGHRLGHSSWQKYPPRSVRPRRRRLRRGYLDQDEGIGMDLRLFFCGMLRIVAPHDTGSDHRHRRSALRSGPPCGCFSLARL